MKAGGFVDVKSNILEIQNCLRRAKDWDGSRKRPRLSLPVTGNCTAPVTRVLTGTSGLNKTSTDVEGLASDCATQLQSNSSRAPSVVTNYNMDIDTSEDDENVIPATP